MLPISRMLSTDRSSPKFATPHKKPRHADLSLHAGVLRFTVGKRRIARRSRLPRSYVSLARRRITHRR
ncbi:hypothetical protein M3616_24070, partial [Bacillus velezensis]|nr:hypothetical protein [Bacillus velezensis]